MAVKGGGNDNKRQIPSESDEGAFVGWHDGLDEDSRQWVSDCVEYVVDFYEEQGKSGKLPANTKSLGKGLYEIKKKRDKTTRQLRVYYMREGNDIVLLLGGDKGSQDRDIEVVRGLVTARKRSKPKKRRKI